ncbi:MAG: adenylosuccinate synthase [Prevotella sp.]|nr:adenylosuccinate synthase [Prevotella sp.]
MNNGKVDVLLGLQWGDEGKGKVVDVMTPNYDVIARFQGGPNAGHTLEFEGQKYVLRSIPSGIFQGGKVNIIGNGVVLAPDLFMDEAKDLERSGHSLKNRLHISKKAHLIMPTHRLLDAALEAAKGKSKVGTTGKGIGPTYTDKISRNGLRVGDIFDRFDEKYAAHKARHEATLKSLGFVDYDISEVEKKWMEGIEFIKQFHIVDSEHEVNNLLKQGKSILCEGAQGTMLDVDFGSYPFVTSSNTICAGACTGLGIGPNKIGEVYGIMKAYCTRVGAGPFPTELFDETGALIRQLGHEYGAVTGRERRCGWIDLVALRYSIMVNGVTQLIMMKSDVLDGFDTIKACVAYKQNGKQITDFPYDIENGIEPVYVELPGWKTDMTSITSESEFPEAFRQYISFLEEQLETPIKIVSVGPDREQTIVRQ